MNYKIESDWLFDGCYDKQVKEYLIDRFAMKCPGTIEDNYRRAVQMQKRTSHKTALHASGGCCDVYVDDQQVCMVCCVVVNSNHTIEQILFVVGPRAFVTKHMDRMKTRFEHAGNRPGGEACIIEENV